MDASKRVGNRLSTWACGEDRKDFGLVGAVKGAGDSASRTPEAF